MLISNIKLKDNRFIGEVRLNNWNAFFENEEKTIELNIGGEICLKNIEQKHILAYQYIIDNQDDILKIILKYLLKEYYLMQDEYGYDNYEKEKYMPDVENIKQFKKLLKPKRIYILDIEKEGIPYFGCSFFCSWDNEHNFGVMMWKDKIIKIGDESIAFLSWVAEDDKFKL